MYLAGGYNTVYKTQTEISPWQQVKMGSFQHFNYLHLRFRLVNFLSISQPLKQLSKVSCQFRSHGHLFVKFSTIIKASVVGLTFGIILCFQDILLKTFRLMWLMYENSSLWGSYLRHSNNIQTTNKSQCKKFDGNKLEVASPT